LGNYLVVLILGFVLVYILDYLYIFIAQINIVISFHIYY
jgi:hypothetical protein